MVGLKASSQFPVAGGQVVEEPVLLIVHELFLDRAVKAFGVGVHFRGAGVRPPVRDAALRQAVLEVAQELRAVVGEHVAWRRQQRGALDRAARAAGFSPAWVNVCFQR